MQKVGKENKKAFLKGAVTIATGGFVAKLIGALYRIPLTNLIGGRGIGLYQLVYPVYCLLLTVSATGIPSSIAKLTAERNENGGRAVFKTAMKLFLIIGGVGTLLMVLLAPLLAKAQGSEGVLFGYYALAPSVFLVSAISVFRGWFQGRNEMRPTALSEITEQLVKVGFGLLFAYLFRDNIEKAVVFLLLSVSLSEGVALLLMLVLYKRVPAPTVAKNEGGRVEMKTVLKLSVPVTLSSILLPASALLDSVLAVRLMDAYATDAVALYGLFSGGAVTMINLPVSIAYGIAVSSVPSVARATTRKERTKRIFFALGLTAVLGLASAVALYFFAPQAVRIVFRSLKEDETQTLIGLVKALSVSALTLSLVQTLSACLTAQGKPQYSALSMLIAVAVKTATYVFLLRDPQISVFGLATATNLCYLVAFFLDLVYNLIINKRKKGEPR